MFASAGDWVSGVLAVQEEYQMYLVLGGYVGIVLVHAVIDPIDGFNERLVEFPVQPLYGRFVLLLGLGGRQTRGDDFAPKVFVNEARGRQFGRESIPKHLFEALLVVVVAVGARVVRATDVHDAVLRRKHRGVPAAGHDGVPKLRRLGQEEASEGLVAVERAAGGGEKRVEEGRG